MTERRLTLSECGKREFTVVSPGVAYRYTSAVGLTFEFDRLRWKWDELHCELTVRCDLAGAGTVNGDVVSVASFNISSDRSRSERATRIVKAAALPDVPVDRLLEEACQRVLTADRQSSASISLHDVPDEDETCSTFTVDGITLDLTQINMFFGLPGSGKSLEAERFALEMKRSGRQIGYIDFEWAAGPHRKRARQMYGPQFPDIRYLRLDRPLASEVDGLQRTIVREGWDFAVIDSVSFGVTGAPESAEVASEFMRCCRQLRIGLLLVAHQSKAEGGDKHPFGSIMWTAGSRSIYHFRRSNSDDVTDSLVTAVTHRKSNAGPLSPPIAIEYSFAADRIDVRRINPASVEDIAPTLSIRHRLRHALQAGPRPIEALATELDVKANSILQTIIRDEAKPDEKRLFRRLPDAHIALLSQAGDTCH
ncbi:MAG: hypothetical protein ABS36_14950 [Acidobacteria bacterium SCN 69-37]|nr:MAG: hypothetical protein ABS36_14950 [Acidobacteria bacterium SCN 69-37]